MQSVDHFLMTLSNYLASVSVLQQGVLKAKYCSIYFSDILLRMGNKQSSLMLIGKDRVRHSSLNVEGSDFYKKMRAEAKAKEEEEKKKKLGSSEDVVEEDDGGEEGEEEEEGAEEVACNFFEDQDWTSPVKKNNFFEEHEEWEANEEEEEDEPGEMPMQLKFERPTIERGESREAKRPSNAGPTTTEED